MDPPGLEDETWWRDRQHDYLCAATQVWRPTSVLNVIDHAEAERQGVGPGLLAWDQVDAAALTRWFERIDAWKDCADFDVLRLLTLWYGYRQDLPDRVAASVVERLRAFRYWYLDPVAPGIVDERWYWSENHRLIFHVCEYLAGQGLADERFHVTGLTGVEHQERAAGRLAEWFEDKARYGFSEWHSDVYYAKDLAPLVTLAEFAEDPNVAERAATFCDLVLYELALHSHRGNTGCTHGRSYMKDKSRAADQPVFGAVKLCFDTTSEPWPLDDGDEADLLPRNESATVFARAARYRPSAVLRRVATTEAEVLDQEHLGLSLDPGEPLQDAPMRADGLSYTDPDLVPFWWDRSALTPWQLVPLTIATLDRHRLWDVPLFALFKVVREGLGGDAEVLRELAADLHPMVNAGLLVEVDTCTWRNRHAMASTAQAYRPGTAGFQHHIWQVTLDERAVVFTTHPGNGPSSHAGDYADHDRYWTGSATLPCAVQHRRVVICRYEPAFAPPEDRLLGAFAYEPYTHAFFPTEHFDDVRTDGHWTFGRRDGGYVALWSWRAPAWRDHDPAKVFTGGLTGRFDLVAAGGADNVWVCEVGDEDRWGSFDRFCAGVAAATVEVDDPGWRGDGAHPGFAVRYASPAEGRIESRPGHPLVLDGTDVALDRRSRFANPFSQVPVGETTVAVSDASGSWVLDLAAGTRGPRR